MRHIGYLKFVQTYHIYPQPVSFELSHHAAGIAWKLQSVDPLAKVLVVISLNLLDPMLDAMQQPQAEPLARTHQKGIQMLNLHPDCLAEVLTEFPFLQSVYEVRRYGLPAETTVHEPLKEASADAVDRFQVISTPKEDLHAALEVTVGRVARHVNCLGRTVGRDEESWSDNLRSSSLPEGAGDPSAGDLTESEPQGMVASEPPLESMAVTTRPDQFVFM